MKGHMGADVVKKVPANNKSSIILYRCSNAADNKTSFVYYRCSNTKTLSNFIQFKSMFELAQMTIFDVYQII